MKAKLREKPVRAAFILIFLSLVGIFLFIHHEQDLLDTKSCSTFVLERDDALFVGHNLDENFNVPGLIVINPRNQKKHSITWEDLKSLFGRSEPQLRWQSKYASLTYNTFGKEFIDGGMNEAGLYVGEMTLLGTQYPQEKQFVRLYHHQWMQYLLDNFATVEEALSTLSQVVPDGHCQWHFFLADSHGNAAVVEFLKGKVVTYTGASLPYKILCNDPYEAELKDLTSYEGFGGTKAADKHHEREDPRFRWATMMIRDFDWSTSPVDYAFSILKRLDLGSNKWSLVYDLKNLRVNFKTDRSPEVRYVNLEDFDLSGAAMVLDINRNLSGHVAAEFVPFTEAMQKKYVTIAWDEIDAGFFGNLFFKPKMKSRMQAYIKDFH